MGLLGFLRRSKGGITPEAGTALTHGALTGELTRGYTDQELNEQLGINIHTIRDEYVLGTINELIRLTGDKGEISFDLYALRNMVSQLFRTSRLDKIDSYILIVKGRRLLRRIEMNLSSYLVELGAINYLETIEALFWTSCCDAVGGWKAKLLKVTPRQIEIAMSQPKKAGGFMSE